MEIRNEYYNEHLKERCREVPEDALLSIIEEFSSIAKFYLSTEIHIDDIKKINGAMLDILKRGRFQWLPLYLVGEAYTKGSLGELGGTTKLSVRNIYIWLTQMEEKMRNIDAGYQSKIDDELRASDERVYMEHQAHNVRFGTALCIKLAWVYEGRITADEWEKYTLDAIVEKLKEGYTDKTLLPSKIFTTIEND